MKNMDENLTSLSLHLPTWLTLWLSLILVRTIVSNRKIFLEQLVIPFSQSLPLALEIFRAVFMPLSRSTGTRESKMNPQVKENIQWTFKSNSLFWSSCYGFKTKEYVELYLVFRNNNRTNWMLITLMFLLLEE